MIIFILTLSSLFVNAQLEGYFSKKGVVLLAQCAHPTNTFERGTYAVDDDFVIVDIFYKEGVHTRLRVNRGRYYFSQVSVVYDDDFVAPFSFLQTMLKIVLDQYKDSHAKDEIQRNLENMLQRKLQEWSGADWALFIINLDYYSS